MEVEDKEFKLIDPLIRALIANIIGIGIILISLLGPGIRGVIISLGGFKFIFNILNSRIEFVINIKISL